MNMSLLVSLYMLLGHTVIVEGSLNKKTDEIAISKSLGSDAQIIGIIGLHGSPEHQKGPCGAIIPKSGVLYLEALRYAVSLVQSQPNYLYGAKLGYTVFDSCRNTARLRDFLSRVILEDHVVGVVGPSTSDEAVFSAPVLGVFSIGMVSFRASSANLDNRGSYDTFFRTVPSDRHQAQAVVDVLRYLNWTYVASINSQGNFGNGCMRGIKKYIETKNICLSREVTLPENPKESDFQRALIEATADKRAKVILLLTNEEESVELLRTALDLGEENSPAIWIGTTKLAHFPLGLAGINNFPGQLITLSEPRVDVPGFYKYISSLNPKNNPYPYFLEFWSAIFNCTFNENSTKRCNGNENLMEVMDNFNDVPVYTIMRAVFKFSSALRSKINSMCISKNSSLRECSANWRFLYNSFQKVHIHDLETGDTVKLDQFGGALGAYDILFYDPEERQHYKTVGTWNQSKVPALEINTNLLRWSNDTRAIPRSVCGEPCLHNQGKVQWFDTTSTKNRHCCWTCLDCHPNAIIRNNTCHMCPMAYKPDVLRSVCLPLPVITISYQGTLSIVTLIMAAVGIALNSIVLFLFIKHKQSKIVRASGRELCYIILFGIYLSFFSSLIFLAPPSVGICGIQRFIAGISLSFCYSPLLFKTNRIYRIFKHAKRSINRPPFVSPLSQIVISNGISCLQILLGIVWIAGDLPEVGQHYPENRKYVLEYCKSDGYTMALNLAVCLVLMIACTYLAFKTRHFPKYYNEAQSIGITMYVSCFVWGVFLPIFLFSKDTINFARTFSIAIFCNVIAYVTLFGLFLMKTVFLLIPRHVGPMERTNVFPSHDSKTTCQSAVTMHKITGRSTQLLSFLQLKSEFKRSVGTSTCDLEQSKKD